ncbi:MAG: zinc ribbon domain-containing protein [Oscillospiraceae bacterium]
MQAFTRNYEDNSTEAGFQFTFYCDICNDGYKSSFVESETQKKNSKLRGFGQGVWAVSNLLGGRLSNVGWAVERGTDVLSERFNGMSAEWQKEHEQAFIKAQNEAQQHFHRCHGCHRWACESDFNEEEGMCVECAPRKNIAVAKAKSQAMQRNLDDAVCGQTVWSGTLESKTIICPVCGKPAGSGKFCNNCGTSMNMAVCPNCGAQNAQGVRFCNECGSPMTASKTSKCPACGVQNPPNTKFCGECGEKLS